jgi:hypothetical protein
MPCQPSSGGFIFRRGKPSRGRRYGLRELTQERFDCRFWVVGLAADLGLAAPDVDTQAA